jgi:DNA invertase Pin-like site-specific DNA recombinase
MRAVGYIRVSTREQADSGLSLAAQRRQIEAYAAYRGLDLVAVVEDAGVSASKPLGKREGGAVVLDLVRRCEAVAVVACKLDRLFRDAADALVNTRAWDGAGVALHLLDLGVDTSSPMGRAFLTMAAAFAELERNLIAERTRVGLEQARREGAILGRSALGWARTDATDDDGRRVVVELDAEAAAVARIVELRDGGATWTAICDALAAEGHATKNGGKWWPMTVRRVYLRTVAAAESEAA